MPEINKEILIAEIAQPVGDEFHRRREACTGWYVYVILPIAVVACGFIWIAVPSVALSASIGISLIWIGLYGTSKKAITKKSREEAYDCFISMFPADHPDFLKAISAFVSIASEDEFMEQVQERLIEESGKTPKELKKLFMQRDYNSRNILDGPVIPVALPEANNFKQNNAARRQDDLSLSNPQEEAKPPKEDKIIQLDLGE